jgi:hypothetical protein
VTIPPANTLLLLRSFYSLRPDLETCAFPGTVRGCFATFAARSLSAVRTDAVNLGFCISLPMLATVARPAVIECFLFFTIPEI